MFKRILVITSALMLAGAASAATAKKAPPVAHPRSQASLQCSAEANAKGLHGKARTSFRHACLRKAGAYHKAASKKAHPAVTHHKPEKAIKKT